VLPRARQVRRGKANLGGFPEGRMEEYKQEREGKKKKTNMICLLSNNKSRV